jgi:hypothetical protein
VARLRGKKLRFFNSIKESETSIKKRNVLHEKNLYKKNDKMSHQKMNFFGVFL